MCYIHIYILKLIKCIVYTTHKEQQMQFYTIYTHLHMLLIDNQIKLLYASKNY